MSDPKPKPKPKQTYSTTTTSTDLNTGKSTSVTKTPIEKAKDLNPQNKDYYAQKMGFYQEVLDAYPDLRQLVEAATADYANGKGWDDNKFWTMYNKTDFAKSRQKAEEEFDIGLAGPNADTYQKKVDDSAANIMQQAGRLGLTISPEEAAAQAKTMVRSNLPTTALDAWWSHQYLGGTTQQDASTMGGKKVTGTAASIQQQLTDAANAYGIKVNPQLLQEKTGEALGQGERWQEWVNGQKGYFKDQAKLLYPQASDLLEKYTLKDIVDPYFSEAADLLGVPAEQMDMSDPKWTGFLNGANGVMSRDEWTRILKTDPTYGYDKTTKARGEMSSLGDELLAAFGKA